MKHGTIIIIVLKKTQKCAYKNQESDKKTKKSTSHKREKNWWDYLQASETQIVGLLLLVLLQQLLLLCKWEEEGFHFIAFFVFFFQASHKLFVTQWGIFVNNGKLRGLAYNDYKNKFEALKSQKKETKMENSRACVVLLLDLMSIKQARLPLLSFQMEI